MKKILALLLIVTLAVPAFSVETKEKNTTEKAQTTNEIKEIMENMDNYEVKGSDKSNKEPTEKQKQAIFMVNYAQYVIYKLKTYNNILALDEEYANLRDNMNLETIDDYNSVKTIQNLMGDLYEEKKNNKNIERLKKSIEKRMNQALYSSVAQGVSQIRASGTDLVSIGISLGVSTLKAGASCFIGYQQYKNELSNEFDEKMFEFKQIQEDNLNDRYKELMDYTYTLVKKHKLSDEWRLNGVELEEIFKYLKDSNKERVFTNLKAMSSGRYVQHFPMFWYHLAKTASDIGKDTEALKYYNRFEKENIEIFRYDRNAVNAYKDKIFILLKDENKDKNKKEIIEKLEFIEKNKTAWEDYYYCALVYSQIGDVKNAQRLLERNITELSAEVDNRFVDAKDINQIYNNFIGNKYYDGLEFSRALLRNLKNKTVPNTSVKDEYEKNTQAFNEYLYYFGLQTSKQLVDNSINNIKDILVSIEPDWFFSKDWKLDKLKLGKKSLSFHDFYVNVKMPMQWVMSSDTNLYALFIKTNEEEILQKQEELEEAKEKLEKLNTKLQKAKKDYDESSVSYQKVQKDYQTSQKMIDDLNKAISETKVLKDLKKTTEEKISKMQDELEKAKDSLKELDKNKKDNDKYFANYNKVKEDYETTQKLVDDLNKAISEAKLLQSKENDKVNNILTKESLNNIENNENMKIIPMILDEKKLKKLKKQNDIHEKCVLIYTTGEIGPEMRKKGFSFGGILLKHNMYPVLFRYQLSIDETHKDIMPSSVFFNQKEYEIK